METVTIKRASTTTDEYGNIIPGTVTTVGTVDLLIAPRMEGESQLVGRTPIETNYNLFNRAALSGILPTDILTVRGQDVPVDGRIEIWYDKAGNFKGEQIQVKLVAG